MTPCIRGRMIIRTRRASRRICSFSGYLVKTPMNKENTITVSHDRRWFCLNDGGIDPSRASLSYYADDAVSSRRIMYIHLGEFLMCNLGDLCLFISAFSPPRRRRRRNANYLLRA